MKLRNIQCLLSVFIDNWDDFAGMNEVYVPFLPEPKVSHLCNDSQK